MDTPTQSPTLPDYPTADLGRPGKYPHASITGRYLVIAHEIDDDRTPDTIEQLARDQGWADVTPEDRATYAAQEQARIDAFARGDWQYRGVVITIRQAWGGHATREIGSAACWGIESDSGADYLATLAAELYDDAAADVADLATILDS